jgi:serine/threonine-protein kinase
VVIDAARRLDELSTARVICEAAEAVHKAQKGGQPVGSVSPKMILVTREGIALDLMAAGSPAYSSPERLEGKPGDRRSDVFSLGAVLWEALAHERLFEDGGDVIAKDVPPPSEMNANVPAELDAIVMKALSRDPAQRYPSAKVMAAELSTLLDDAGYPDSHEEVAKYLESVFPAGAKLVSTPASPGPTTTQKSKALLNQTVLGMAPIREPDLAAAKAGADKAAAEKAAAEQAAAKAAAEQSHAEDDAEQAAAKDAAERAAAE